jgi:hypothetical protein
MTGVTAASDGLTFVEDMLGIQRHPLIFCIPPAVPAPRKGPCPGTKHAAKKAAKAAAGKPASRTPMTISSKEFEKTFPKDKRFYRGVKSSAGAAHTRQGGLGSGDYGAAIYIDGRIATAQGYSGIGQDGRIMRMAIAPGTKVKKLPDRVSVRGRDAIEHWVQDNDPDVFSDWLGMHHMVRNPGVLIIDEHDYSKRESAVMDMLNGGYDMPEGYQAEIGRLRELLGIDIPDEGNGFR